NGLDPAGIREIRDLLRTLADERGTTIFMSSHILAEVDRLADRIGIIHDGLLVEELDRESLERSRRKRVQVAVDDPEKAERILRGELGLSYLERFGDGSIGISDEGAQPERIARALVGAGLALKSLAIEGEDLEEHFLRLTGGGT
ncbi:MAG: ABC transporter ATP-binding protein, partial [Spirochaetaceae bacterium]|nr:ABC transporter ATP-binding protein [Spirochaetaceae bacterium]